MAKKKNRKPGAGETGRPEDSLPRNILPLGETVDADKCIYLSQPVYREIHKFTRNKTVNESGGILVGTVREEFGKTHILISGFVEARYCESTPTTLTFTHETWDYVHKEIEKRFPEKKILGWIHTHPDFGIFLSEYDKFIHENFFRQEDQIAYVVDPIQGIEGFYFWINGKLERCKGFYVFDRTGVPIDLEHLKEAAEPERRGGRWKDILLGVLAAAVAGLLLFSVSLHAEVKKLQQQQEMIVFSANQSLAYLQQQILALAPAETESATAEMDAGASEETETMAPAGSGELPGAREADNRNE